MNREQLDELLEHALKMLEIAESDEELEIWQNEVAELEDALGGC